MGNRRNIEVRYTDGGPIYFYTHWCADELDGVVAAALERGRDRWGDEPYLARIVFSEMIGDDSRLWDTTGYGISPHECDPENPTIVLDIPNQTVNNVPFADWVKRHKSEATP